MDKFTLSEVAYHNGYEKGFKDGAKEFAELLKERTPKETYRYVAGFSLAEMQTDYLRLTTDDVNNLLKELTEGDAE